MNHANVISIEDKFKYIPPHANEDSPRYNKFYVVDQTAFYIFNYIRSGKALKDIAESNPANFIDFLENFNHGMYDTLANGHLLVDQGVEGIVILNIVNGLNII